LDLFARCLQVSEEIEKAFSLFVFSYFCSSLTLSFLAWRVGQRSVDDELRRVNRRLMDLQEQLNRTAVAASSSPALAGGAPLIEPDRDVALLIRQNRAKIDDLRSVLGAEIDCLSWDDLALLRYVLSFKDIDDAAEAVRKAISWRHENKVSPSSSCVVFLLSSKKNFFSRACWRRLLATNFFPVTQRLRVWLFRIITKRD
jgi:hypothetical protein